MRFNLFNDHHETLTTMTEPASDPTRDYRWRLSISRAEWLILAARLADAVNYLNFKSACHDQPSQSNKSLAYLRIWQTMHDLQRSERDAEDIDRLGRNEPDDVPWKSPTTVNEPDEPPLKPW